VIGPDLFALSELWRHYRVCRRNKRNTRSALNFEFALEGNLLALQAELRGRSYRPGTPICFLTEGPKPREVFAADFRDRIVHHLLVSHQERVFEPGFIHDSYACRRGKGTLAASTRAMQFLRQATENGQCGAWVMKLDVASFFPSVHKPTLFEILTRRVRHPALVWLTQVLLFHDPTEDYQFQTKGKRVPPPRTPGYPISPQRSLFASADPGVIR
jgi:retron-type reverse transcriptase